MGKAFSLEDVLIVGERILTLRIAFNLREGIKNVEKYSLPKRVLGDPQLKDGSFKKIIVDSSIQIKDYYNALGWNPDTGVPSAEVFERLGLCFAAYLADF
jgi:aldehyde:ferredoxin oxidoreductase